MSELCFNQCVWDFGTDQVEGFTRPGKIRPVAQGKLDMNSSIFR